MGSRVRENDGIGEYGSVMVTNLSAVRVCRVASFLETKALNSLPINLLSACLFRLFLVILAQAGTHPKAFARRTEWHWLKPFYRYFFRASST